MEKILLLTENGFEDRELMYPFYRFQEAGYQVVVVGPRAKEIYNGEHGLTITADLSPAEVNIDGYVGVIVPGGRAPDRMRRDKGLVKLVKDAVEKGKLVAAICHGPQLLIEADVARGKRMTCFMSVATDLKNAGAIYEDKSVVVDGKFVTSRSPADLPDFCREALRVLGKIEP
jgi:protease I